MPLNLIIDIGNSRVKVAVFKAGVLQTVVPFSHEDFPTALPKWVVAENIGSEIQYLGCASVGKKELMAAVSRLADDLPQAQWLAIDHQTPLPVANAYRTPETLGMDRICACIGGRSRTTQGRLLVIDAGTAITYDYLDAENRYQGGGIAPGIRLRFRSLNDYTASLPLVETQGDTPLVGYNTETSIRSGVVNGMVAEVAGVVEAYRKLAPEPLTVYLTGGDGVFLGNRLKSINFVDSDLLLYGIHTVVSYYFENA